MFFRRLFKSPRYLVFIAIKKIEEVDEMEDYYDSLRNESRICG